ncbi:hypothetical protein [Microbacterium sp.]|uniref:hypothetical protein n=1 Tax=Microbacterium sp. TaxID=51671 RepID=UPI002810B734|nr:hypothetical protein [Microbacterium sp.]
MTDSRTRHVERPLAPAPGLQLIGTDADAGLCVDGICVLPGQQGAMTPVEKTD